MSDYIYRFIPLEVGVSPKDINEERISLLLSEGTKYDSLQIKRTDDISFIDCGSNLEIIKCNFCGNELNEVWGNYMGYSHNTGFEDRKIYLDCCNREGFLEDLHYYFDVGFSRFVIEISNPTNFDYTVFLVKLYETFNMQFKCIIAQV